MDLRVVELGTDKVGKTWFVGVQLLSSDSLTPFTAVNFFVFPNRNYHKRREVTFEFGCGVSIRDSSKSCAKIEDLVVPERLENRGIGSLLLSFVEVWLRQQCVREIHGKLNEADSGHYDKLEYFYKKHGYSFDVAKREIRKILN